MKEKSQIWKRELRVFIKYTYLPLVQQIILNRINTLNYFKNSKVRKKGQKS